MPLTSPNMACSTGPTPSGERVSALAPDDHPHHRGIYLRVARLRFRTAIDAQVDSTRRRSAGVSRKLTSGDGAICAARRSHDPDNAVKLASATPKRRSRSSNEWMVGKRKMLEETTVTRVSERDGVYVHRLYVPAGARRRLRLNKQSFSGFNFQGRKDGESVLHELGGTVIFRPALFSAGTELASGAVVRLRGQGAEREGRRERR